MNFDTDVSDTPSIERLIEWAAANPPPQHWLDGAEEDLFGDDLETGESVN